MKAAPESRTPAPKRVALNMKATPELRAKVEAAAKRSGLSIAQEVERRLIASIDADDRSSTPQEAAFFDNARRMVERISLEMGEAWTDEHDSWRIVRSGLIYLVDQYEPLERRRDYEPNPASINSLDDYDRAHRAWRERQIDIARRAAEAYLRLQDDQLSIEERQHYKTVQEEAIADSDPEPLPDLPESELEKWKAYQDWRQKADRAFKGAVAVLHFGRR